MSKRKGTRAERELAHKFYSTNQWIVCRSAGSGSTTIPNPDLIVGCSKKDRVLAIECKSIKQDRKYFPRQEIEQLQTFSEKFGAEPWIGIRFDNIGWFFIHTKKLLKSKGKSFVITLAFSRKKGLNFDELIGLYKQKRLK